MKESVIKIPHNDGFRKKKISPTTNRKNLEVKSYIVGNFFSSIITKPLIEIVITYVVGNCVSSAILS